MKFWMVRLALAAGLAVAQSATAEDSALAWSYKYILASSEAESQLLPVLAGIADDATLRKQPLCDHVAESLHTMAQRGSESKYLFGDYARVLANCENSRRYFEQVRLAARKARLPAVSASVRKYEERVRGQSAPAYLPGSVDFAAIRRDFAHAAFERKPSMQVAENLVGLTKANMDEIFARVGKPDVVRSRDVTIDKEKVFVEIRQLWFIWRGVGRIAFNYRHKDGWNNLGFVGDPLAFERYMPYREQPQGLGQPDDAALSLIQLVSNQPSARIAAGQAEVVRDKVSLEFMDTAAEVLLEQFDGALPDNADSYAWLCRVLREHGGMRYAGVLQKVAKLATNGQLKHNARVHEYWQPDLPRERYKPGSVSLAAQRQKYPSLYPEMSLIHGEL
jgi:hypothetical protein